MRGKVFVGCQIFFLSRITPAYAGKRKFRRLFLDEFRDHPRLCGEKRTAGRLENQYSGSPPPMRGKGIFFRSISAFSRITPAYAGKSVPPDGLKINIRDHPRLCGEKEWQLIQ